MKKLLSLSTILILGLASALQAQHSLSQFSVPSAKQKLAQQFAPSSHAQSPGATGKRQPARSRPNISNPPVNPVGFVNATSIPAGGLTQWSAVEADFNGDGKPDMAAPVQTVETPAAYAVSVVLNGGNGTFQTAVLTPNPNGVDGDQLLVGDFNGDGKQDLIVVHATSPATFEIWLGNGDGSFNVGTHARTTITSNFVEGGVVTTDANGHLDLIFVDSHSPGNVVTFVGNGNGTFAASPPVAVSAGPLSDVAFADFNGDGILDFVATFSNSNGKQNGVFLGQSSGGYGAPILLTNPDGVYEVCNNSVGDLNGDGKPEIVSANCYLTGLAGNLTVYLNKGSGTFQTGVYYSAGTESVDNTTANIGPVAVTIADVNGDGKNDIVSSDSTGGDVTILMGNGDGTVNVPTVGYSTGGFPKTSALVADFNGDGLADIVVPDYVFSFAYLQGYGDGTFRSPLDFYSPVPGGYGALATTMATGDFNGDGYPDFVLGNVGYNNPNGSGIGITVFLSNPDGSLQPGVNYGTGGSYEGVSVGYFTGSSNLDIAAVNESNGGIQIFKGNGDGSFASGLFYSTGGADALTIVTGDFNHDGFPDLAVVNSNPQSTPPTYNITVSVLLNNGTGGFTTPAAVYTVNSSTGIAEDIAAADINNDGILDLIVTENNPGVVAVLLGNADGTFQTASTPAFTYNFLGNVAFGDLNGDGKLDLAVTVADKSTGTGLAVAEGNGDGTFKPAVLYSTTLQNVNLGLDPLPGAIQMLDLNGDGKLDLVYSNTGYGTIGVLYNTGTNPFATGMFYDPVEYSAGSYVSALALVDVDGDGAVDVVAADSDFAGATILLNTSGSINTLAASANPAVASQSVTLTATVAGVRGVTTVPTGSVTFFDGSTSLGSSSLSGGVATLSTSAMAVGTHSVTAQYSGDSNFHSVTSAVLSEVITLAADSTALLSSVNPAGAGQSVTFTATITSTSGGATAAPTGTVTFSDGSTILGTNSVTSRIATFSSSSLALGNHSITAAYSGDPNFAASSSVLTQAVVAPDFALGAAPATMTVNAGSSAPYVISVTPSYGYNGTVAFTCPSTLPTKVTCSFSPTSVSPSNGAYATTTLSLATTAATASLALPGRPGSRSASPMILASLGGFGVFGLILAGVGSKRNRRHMAVLGIVLLVMMFTFIGCGGSSSNSGTNSSVPGTPAGTYTVTVTAAGNGASAPTHTLNVTLVVQ
jgi:hypothetical protein